MTEVIAEVVPGHPAGVLTGPNLAREIVAGQPAATVVAMTDEAMAREVQELLRTETFRVYTNPDVVGCEMAGATKNVLAIAAGILQGLGLGRLVAGRAHHPRPGRAGTPRRGHGRRAHHDRRTGGRGRPGGHVHQLAEPEPDGGGAAGPGPVASTRSWRTCAWWPKG